MNLSKIKTWHIETAVIAAILLTVTISVGGGGLELLGSGAVLLSFGHASIGNRLVEREAAREVVTVECHKSLVRYWIGKEILWFVYFVLHGSWSALTGVGIFLLYPLWRKWYRKMYPMLRKQDEIHY